MTDRSPSAPRDQMSLLIAVVLTVSAAAAAFAFFRRRQPLPAIPKAVRSPRRYFSAFKTAAQEVADIEARREWENEGGSLRGPEPTQPKA